MWKDSSRAEEAAEKMKLTAKDLLDLGVIDEVLKEPNGNAKTDVEKMSETIKKKIVRISKELQQMDKAELLEARYKKFREI